MFNNMQYNPYGYNMSQNQSNNSLLRVNGLDGAKAYQMNPNSVVALFDSNDDYFYLKTSDSAGFSSIRKFKFVEETETPTINISADDYVSREEYEQFKREVMDIGKQFIQFTKSTANTTDSTTKQSASANDQVISTI